MSSFNRLYTYVLISSFLGTSVAGAVETHSYASLPDLPEPGSMVSLSSSYIPAHLMGMTIHPDNPLKFDFLIHKGDGNLSQGQKKTEYTKLVKYFLASLTVPDKDQWVNLSPYEKNRIIEDNFGKTEMGRDLLFQDYLLKQITSSLMYPESGLGKSFWDKVYAEAYKKYGNASTALSINTFNKVWIVPDKATVYESKGTAYIIQSHLKVMLEEDYLAQNRGQRPIFLKNVQDFKNRALSPIMREIILPAIEKEVNEGKNFAQLRQIVSGMILATWYKRSLKESLLGKIYADKAKIKGVTFNNSVIPAPAALLHKAKQQGGIYFKMDPRFHGDDIESIYQQYLKAFKKGVYNYIKEDEDKYTHQSIPRKYFAGGFQKFEMVESITNSAKMTQELRDSAVIAFANAAQIVDQAMFDMTPQIKAYDPGMNSSVPVESKPTRGRNNFMVSLESVGAPSLMHARLLRDAADQVVITDIPFSGRLYQWIKKKDFSWESVKGYFKGTGLIQYSDLSQGALITVANNARWWSTIKRRVSQSVAESMGGVFVVSGGGIFQRLFSGVPSYLGGPIKSPQSIAFAADRVDDYQNIYVAWNPNDSKDTVERLNDKMRNGAKAVITQPPFLWDHFKKSIREFRAKNSDIPVIIGVPVFTSVKNVRIWMDLIGIDWWNNDDTRKLVWDAEKAEKISGDFAAFRTDWTVKFIEKIKTEIPEANGIHLMPMGAPETVIYNILGRTKLFKESKDFVRQDIDRSKVALKAKGIRISHESSLMVNELHLRRFREALKVLLEVVNEIPRELHFQVAWNWNAYRQHFQPDIGVHDYGEEHGSKDIELAINLAAIQGQSPQDLKSILKLKIEEILEGRFLEKGVRIDREFRPHSQSLAWPFNVAFWRYVQVFMKAIGRDYRASIGGSPDTKPKLITYTADHLLDDIQEAVKNRPNGDVKPFAYVEVGIASIDHVALLVPELERLAKKRNLRYLLNEQNINFVLIDFSDKILKEAQKQLQHRLGRAYRENQFRFVQGEAKNPNGKLQEYAGRILRYHATNVFDNLPTDQIARRNNKYYDVHSRLYIPQRNFNALIKKYNLDHGELLTDFTFFKGNGVEGFLEKYRARMTRKIFYHFWQDVWNALRFEEKFIPKENLDPELKVKLNEVKGDFKMFLSNEAIAGIKDVYKLLHPQGGIEIIDMMTSQLSDYQKPQVFVKYDGSIATRLNGPLFQMSFPAGPLLQPLSLFGDTIPGRYILEIPAHANPARDVETPGGIDLNASNLDMTIKRDGKGVPLPLAQQDLAQLSRIEGFEPHIIEIKPATDLPILSELRFPAIR